MKAGQRKLTSLKVKLLLLFCVVLIPQALFFVWYGTDMLQKINERIAQSEHATLSLLSNSIAEEIADIENDLAEIALNNESFRHLGVTEDELDSYIYSYDIFNNKNLLDANDDIAALVIYNGRSDSFFINYGLMDSYSLNDRLQTREPIEDAVKHILDSGSIVTNGWFLLETEDRCYYCQAVSYYDAYCICLFDFEHAAINVIKENDIDGKLVFRYGDVILNEREWIEELDIVFEDNADYYITGQPTQQFVVQTFKSDIMLSYFTEYASTIKNMTIMQLQLLGMGIFTFLTILVAYINIRKRILKPMHRLVETMEHISSGNLEVEADWEYKTAEFYLVNSTFNNMISQIKQLKIETYEKQISKEQAKLKALRLQIRSHFFLNCLKTLYGMAETKQYSNIQQYLILLSNHLNYIFRDNGDLVMIDRELKSCQNYISLQKLNLSNPPIYSMSVDAIAKEIMIPPITLLTFVENCFKHGTQIGKQLEISLNISWLVSEEERLLNITIHDNGPGFDKELLPKLNNFTENYLDVDGVGIINVISRFQLIFGDRFAIAFANRNGATVNIFITPDAEDGRKGGSTNEFIGS